MAIHGTVITCGLNLFQLFTTIQKIQSHPSSLHAIARYFSGTYSSQQLSSIPLLIARTGRPPRKWAPSPVRLSSVPWASPPLFMRVASFVEAASFLVGGAASLPLSKNRCGCHRNHCPIDLIRLISSNLLVRFICSPIEGLVRSISSTKIKRPSMTHTT